MPSNEAVAHQANALAECCREHAKDIYGWIEPLCKPLIATMKLDPIGFAFKYSENGLRRGASIELSGERVGCQVISGLPLIIIQGLFEDGLEVWSG